MGLGDVFKIGYYHSDDGGIYSVKLSQAMCTEGGFETGDFTVGYPYNSKDMRHVLGVDDAGHRTKCYVATASDPLFVDSTHFDLHGRTYKIQGRIGEARKLSHIGG